MASREQDISPKGSVKAKNRGGRPRKYATAQEAQAQEVERQKQKRHQQQQPRESKAGYTTPGALQFIPYQPPSTKSNRNLPTQTVRYNQEQQASLSKTPPLSPPLQQQTIQDVEPTTGYGSPTLADLEPIAGVVPQTPSAYPLRDESPLPPANIIEAAAILSKMLAMQQFHFLLPDLLRFQSSLEAAMKLLSEPTISRMPYRAAKDVEGPLREIADSELELQVGVMVARPAHELYRPLRESMKLDTIDCKIKR
ncbi:hypothetical protein F5882DRAFT_525061 [Hyaloscypha sp. PMI_1271]|nr:hypothetical protein F5882DRAFT_525061 [Hyaloscypha sp. PMI_1271]